MAAKLFTVHLDQGQERIEPHWDAILAVTLEAARATEAGLELDGATLRAFRFDHDRPLEPDEDPDRPLIIGDVRQRLTARIRLADGREVAVVMLQEPASGDWVASTVEVLPPG